MINTVKSIISDRGGFASNVYVIIVVVANTAAISDLGIIIPLRIIYAPRYGGRVFEVTYSPLLILVVNRCDCLSDCLILVFQLYYSLLWLCFVVLYL